MRHLKSRHYAGGSGLGQHIVKRRRPQRKAAAKRSAGGGGAAVGKINIQLATDGAALRGRAGGGVPGRQNIFAAPAYAGVYRNAARGRALGERAVAIKLRQQNNGGSGAAAAGGGGGGGRGAVAARGGAARQLAGAKRLRAKEQGVKRNAATSARQNIISGSLLPGLRKRAAGGK